MKTIYKGYIIESYAERKLIGGPYENNEERQYRETGKTLFHVDHPKKHQYFPSSETLKEAKLKVRQALDTKRTKKLQAQHAKEVKRLLDAKKKLNQLERELYKIGADYERPHHGLSW